MAWVGYFYGNMKEIQLTKGYVAKVDDADFEWINAAKWHASKHCNKIYARGVIDGKHVYMHRLILNPSPNEFCDHIDRDTMNNQRSNLRKCTWAENQRNKSKKKNATSKYMGVVKTQNGTYKAQVTHMGKLAYSKRFKTEIEAARAYNEKKKELHGEFANLNVI